MKKFISILRNTYISSRLDIGFGECWHAEVVEEWQ